VIVKIIRSNNNRGKSPGVTIRKKYWKRANTLIENPVIKMPSQNWSDENGKVEYTDG
jgi:hypothetical protein